MAQGIDIKPLTPDLWPQFETVMGRSGCGGCWCMYWRISRADFARGGRKNKASYRRLVERGPPPGLILFVDGEPAGWAQVYALVPTCRRSTARVS